MCVSVVVMQTKHTTIKFCIFIQKRFHVNIAFIITSLRQPFPAYSFSLSHTLGIAFYINGYSSIVYGIQNFFSFFNQNDEDQNSTVFTHLYANEFLDGLVITTSKRVVVKLPDSSKKFVGVIAVDFKSQGAEFIVNSFLVRESMTFCAASKAV